MRSFYIWAIVAFFCLVPVFHVWATDPAHPSLLKNSDPECKAHVDFQIDEIRYRYDLKKGPFYWNDLGGELYENSRGFQSTDPCRQENLGKIQGFLPVLKKNLWLHSRRIAAKTTFSFYRDRLTGRSVTHVMPGVEKFSLKNKDVYVFSRELVSTGNSEPLAIECMKDLSTQKISRIQTCDLSFSHPKDKTFLGLRIRKMNFPESKILDAYRYALGSYEEYNPSKRVGP